jgi:putative hemolysin
MSDLLRVLAVLALVAGNAFFVVGEYAVVTARRAALTSRAEAGSRGAAAALRLMADPIRVISTVQVGITAIGILTGAVGEPLVRDLLGDALPGWLNFVIAFAVVTYLSVVLGELVPKTLTLDRAETLVALIARPVEWIAIVLAPVVWVLQRSAQVLLRPLGVTEVVAGESVRTPEELRAVVDEAEQSGVIPRAQEEMLHNIFDFAVQEAGDIMLAAADVAWLDADTTADDALAEVVERPHTRYPVGRGSFDNLVGVVHVRELIAAARKDPQTRVESLASPVPVIPPTKDVGALLRELREARQQVAVVADEYGRTMGIVTLEDILEEIVGEIEDEYDLPDNTLTWLSDSAVRVAGSMTIDDFNEVLGTDLPQDGARTLAGLVFAALGRVPEEGETVSVDPIRFTVEQLDGPRITRLRVDLPAGRRASATG